MSDTSATLERHLASTGCAEPIFRKAYERKILSLQLNPRFNTNVPNRLLEQTRISILSWNPGLRRGKPGAIEEHIAGKWHIIAYIALREAVEYLQHECLMNHFYITHSASCAGLFNKDTFLSDVQVNSSVYIHDTRTGQQVVKEGQSGWVLQAVLSRASFRRLPCMMSLLINNQYAKKRRIDKKKNCYLQSVRMRQEQVDMVAGDFNSAAWRRRSDNEQRRDSTIEEAFPNTNLPIPLGPTTLWNQVVFQVNVRN